METTQRTTETFATRTTFVSVCLCGWHRYDTQMYSKGWWWPTGCLICRSGDAWIFSTKEPYYRARLLIHKGLCLKRPTRRIFPLEDARIAEPWRHFINFRKTAIFTGLSAWYFKGLFAGITYLADFFNGRRQAHWVLEMFHHLQRGGG